MIFVSTLLDMDLAALLWFISKSENCSRYFAAGSWTFLHEMNEEAASIGKAKPVATVRKVLGTTRYGQGVGVLNYAY